MPQVQVTVRGGPVARGRMADRGRAAADAVAGQAGRTARTRASARARHRAAGRAGRVEAGAEAAGLAVRGPAGRDGGRRRDGHVGRDARAGEVVAARRPMVGRQPRAAGRDADGRPRAVADTRHVRAAGRRPAGTARVLGRRQE